jgi:hypothetical protein
MVGDQNLKKRGLKMRNLNTILAKTAVFREKYMNTQTLSPLPGNLSTQAIAC